MRDDKEEHFWQHVAAANIASGDPISTRSSNDINKT
jgi:hypothetical protein